MLASRSCNYLFSVLNVQLLNQFSELLYLRGLKGKTCLALIVSNTVKLFLANKTVHTLKFLKYLLAMKFTLESSSSIPFFHPTKKKDYWRVLYLFLRSYWLISITWPHKSLFRLADRNIDEPLGIWTPVWQENSQASLYKTFSSIMLLFFFRKPLYT